MEFSSNLLSYLASVALRSLILASVAAAAIFVFRVKSAAVRHAVWTIAALGMLALGVLAPLLAPIEWRVLRPAPPAAVFVPAPVPAVAATSPAAPVPAPPIQLTWADAAAALYVAVAILLLVRLAFGYAFTVRLVRASRELDAPGLYESDWISVPLTVGWFRPKILLPADWREWERSKLEAVLAHERTHVRRGDWAISVMTGVNRSVFWFHPLAWWLERRLASLAEQACDDAALLEVGTAPYAQALLDMAAAVKTGQGRLVWEAMAMAKASEVRMRIERILDETRQIPRALTRVHWAALALGALPLIYVASALRPVPAAAQQPTPAQVVITQGTQTQTGKKGSRPRLSPDEVPALEQQLTANPQDLDVRRQLMLYYFQNGMREQGLTHAYWLITNHPESPAAGLASIGIPPNDPVYQRAGSLWEQQVAAHPTDTHVLGNAASFFTEPGGDLEKAERLLIAERAIEPGAVSPRLGRVYGLAILSTAGDPAYPNTNPSFAQRAKNELEKSTDRMLVLQAANTIISAARGDQHPLLNPVADWAKTSLLKVPAGSNVQVNNGPEPPPVSNIQPLTKVDPQYPALARQARVSGDIYLTITVGPDGHITHIQVIMGHPLLIPAALEAVKQWVYSPSNAGTFNIMVPFRLDGANATTPGGAAAFGGSAFPAPTDGTQRIRIGGAVQAAKLVQGPPPQYPDLAAQARISGVVHLHALIGVDGHVKGLELISGHPLLAPAAFEAVKDWVYQPTTLQGQPVEVDTVIDVNFPTN
jgi:TonB family protein